MLYGTFKTVEPVLKFAGKTLKKDEDYTVTYIPVTEGAEVKDGKLKSGPAGDPYEYRVEAAGMKDEEGHNMTSNNITRYMKKLSLEKEVKKYSVYISSPLSMCSYFARIYER